MTLEFEEGREYAVTVGDSISNPQSSRFLALNIAEDAVAETAQDRQLRKVQRSNSGSVTAQLTTGRTAPDENVLSLAGIEQPSDETDCVILYDPATETFRIEVLSASATLNKTDPMQGLALPSQPAASSSLPSSNSSKEENQSPAVSEARSPVRNDDDGNNADDSGGDFDDLIEEIDKVTPVAYPTSAIALPPSLPEEPAAVEEHDLDDMLRDLDDIPATPSPFTSEVDEYEEGEDMNLDDLESELDSAMDTLDEASPQRPDIDSVAADNQPGRRPISLSAKLGEDAVLDAGDDSESD
ncbi:hypothetical protein RI367_003046 [Sorochytrium milnesiophthora]